MAHLVPTRSARARTLAQRGLTPVEYALGLLAAATVALVLLRIFGDNEFYKTLFDWVVNVFTTMAKG